MSIIEYDDINTLVTDYLRAHGMSKTASCIEQDIKSTPALTQTSTSTAKPKSTPRAWKPPA